MNGINTDQIRWFMLLDMLGYYLLLVPAVFFIHRILEQRTAWASLFTSLGFGYVLIGAIGAAALAVAWPALIIRHASADASMQEIYKADFLVVTEFVVKGLWNYLEVLVAGVWWLGIGFFAIENRSLKITTLILGASCILDGVGELFQVPMMAELGLNIYLVLAIVWPVWLGVAMVKNRI